MNSAQSAFRWKDRLRFSIAVLAAAAAAYALDRWFFSGVTASKWIGLPQYAFKMNRLKAESEIWGMAALAAEGLALLLVLPRWTTEKLTPSASSVLAQPPEQNLMAEYAWKCIFRVGLCLLGTVVGAACFLLIANLPWLLARIAK